MGVEKIPAYLEKAWPGFDLNQKKEFFLLVSELANKLEDALLKEAELTKREEGLKSLNRKLLDKIQEARKEFQGNFDTMVEMLVRNQIEYEEDLYNEKVEKRVRGGFIHEAPF